MPSCIVPYCTNSSSVRKNPFYKNLEQHIKISFHRLPRNENRRNIWLKSLQISEPIPKSGVVCSLHFNEQDFNRTLTRIVLRENAVPSYYPFDRENKENTEDIQFEDSIHDVSFSSLSSTDVQSSKQLKDISNHNIPMGTHSQQDNDISAEEMILDEVTGNFVIPKGSTTKDENDVSLNISYDENFNVTKSVRTQGTSISLEYNQSDKETNYCLLALLKEKEQQLQMQENALKEKEQQLQVQQKDLKEKELQLQVQQKDLKIFKRKLVRKEKVIRDLKDVIKTVDKKQLLNKNQLCNLQDIGESNKDLLRRIINKSSRVSVSRQYPPELRSFAPTMHYCSPRAYECVGKKFNSCLPNPKTIYRWYRYRQKYTKLNQFKNQ